MLGLSLGQGSYSPEPGCLPPLEWEGLGWGTARGLWERGLCVHVCVTGSVFWSGAWRAGKVWPETEEPKAGPSSAVQTLGVSRPFLLDEGLDDPVSQGPVNFDILTFQAVVRAVLSVSLRGHRCRVCTCVCVCVCVCEILRVWPPTTSQLRWPPGGS